MKFWKSGNKRGDNKECVILELHLSGLGITVFKAELREIVGLLRRNIGKDGNNALCAERHHRNDLVVVARPDIEIVAALRHGLSEQGEVAGSSLDAVDVRVLGQLGDRVRSEAYAGTARHVVENDRQVRAVCNRVVVRDQTALGGRHAVCNAAVLCLVCLSGICRCWFLLGLFVLLLAVADHRSESLLYTGTGCKDH